MVGQIGKNAGKKGEKKKEEAKSVGMGKWAKRRSRMNGLLVC